MTRAKFEKLFPRVNQCGTIAPFLHKGDWAIHELLPLLLEGTSGRVRIATFSVSEDSLRPLFALCEQGAIGSLSLLLDTTVKRHKFALLNFAAHITPQIAIDAVHSKILLVEYGDKRLGIVGSANLNLNHRWECGFYFTAGEHFDFFSAGFDKAFENALQIDL